MYIDVGPSAPPIMPIDAAPSVAADSVGNGLPARYIDVGPSAPPIRLSTRRRFQQICRHRAVRYYNVVEPSAPPITPIDAASVSADSVGIGPSATIMSVEPSALPITPIDAASVSADSVGIGPSATIISVEPSALPITPAVAASASADSVGIGPSDTIISVEPSALPITLSTQRRQIRRHRAVGHYNLRGAVRAADYARCRIISDVFLELFIQLDVQFGLARTTRQRRCVQLA